MSDFLIKKVLAKLGVLCLEYHSEGYFSCLGEPPNWSVELFPCIRNRFPQILPIDISPFLDNFMVDAVDFWQQESSAVLRSGYWTETKAGLWTQGSRTSTHEVNLEALVLNVDSTPLLLLEVSDVKFDETFKWLQLARRERLDSLVERKANASQMTSLSLFDPLTGLSNEQAFSIQLAQWIEQLRQGFISQFLLVKLNIDRFRHINFTLGRSRGDQCLVQLARRVKRFLWEQDVFARLGADEFVALVRVPGELSAEAWVERLMAELQSPYRLETEQLQTTVSLGVLKVEDPNANIERCLADVSIALNQAKERGRGQSCWFELHWRDHTMARLRQEQQLLSAIKAQTLQLQWQPIFSSQNHKVVGVEPYLNSPELGQNGTELQQLAWETGLSNQLAIYRVESCLTLLSDRPAKRPLIFLLATPLQCLRDPQFLQALTRVIQSLGKTDQVVLKLTELSDASSTDSAAEALKQVQSANVRIGVMLDSIQAISAKVNVVQMIGCLTIDLGRTAVKIGIDGKINHPYLKNDGNQDYLVIADSIESGEIYEQAIASSFIDLYMGNHLSEPLPMTALLQLLKS